MRFEQATVHYGKRMIFSDFSLELEEGRITCIMGASGIGKTTLLRLAAGLQQPHSGTIERKAEARIGYVFQEPRLLSSKTVLGNVRWVLDDLGTAAKNADALTWLDEAGLAHVLTSYPDQLSGGMKQRVSVVRAFLSNPGLLLMDEPFQSLDAATRRDMQKLLLNLWHKEKPTVLLVTHDLDEALALGSHIVVLGGNPVKSIFRITAMNEAGVSRFSVTDVNRLKQIVNAHTPHENRSESNERELSAYELG